MTPPTSDEIQEAIERGRILGQLDAIEKMQQQQNHRLDDHDKRIKAQERIMWGLLGAIALIQSPQVIRAFVGG